MKVKDRRSRNLKIFQFMAIDNTLFDAALHFRISVNQLFRINKDLKLEAVEKVKNGGLSTEGVAKEMGVTVEYINSIIRDWDEGKLRPDPVRESSLNDETEMIGNYTE